MNTITRKADWIKRNSDYIALKRKLIEIRYIDDIRNNHSFIIETQILVDAVRLLILVSNNFATKINCNRYLNNE